ncbi:flagellar basal-body MS-ring/collar protein FliF [Rhodococcus sp. X156]|uniref:flagellar basal-body MS-ring/collar protein FliF n=1 Tax=Rhodococcus sp. X156 TaxID=2499145 RepID=UPI0013E3699F|nr:flagellar basal-body MS-ring/collar protein FliF [Rhodococcus sp. X156]
MKNIVVDRAQRFWQGFLAFTPGQKVVSVAAVLALTLGGFFFTTWASAPTYAPLFTNLAPTDASAMIDKLNATGTPYELAANGTSIMVPEKDVYALRLTMSSAGLPTSGKSGYSLLDNEGITTSEFKQQVDYQRALEGEIGNTVRSIDGVVDATVHLAIPKDTVYDDGTKKPTGAVLLTTAPGTKLTSGQVQSVVNLVSSSVPGLTADQVSVSDSTGKVLSALGEDDTAAGSDTRSEATRQYESRLNTAVQQMLDQMVGAGHSVVTVNADLDFDKTNTVSQTYVYDAEVPPLAESSTTETYNGGAGDNGVLGAAATPPVAGADGATDGNGGYTKTTGTKNNAVGQVTDTRNSAPGQVRNLNVAVLLDRNAPAVDQAALQQLVSSAVGLDTERGDTLAVASAPFDTTAADAAADTAAAAAAATAASEKREQLMSMAKTLAVVVLVAVLVVATLIANRRRRKAALRTEPAYDPDEFLSALNDSPDLLPPAPQDIVPPSTQASTQAAARAREQGVAALAGNEPHEVARLLRSWLNEKDK